MTLDQHPGHDRLSEKAVLHLATEGDFLSLADLANSHAKKLHGHRIAYLIDCNINYTNICRTQCAFCAFSRPKGHTEAWELSKDELDKKIQNAKTRGSQRVLLQGGMHPDHTLTDYEQLVAHIKQTHHIHVHAFSPPEIHFIAEKSGVTTKHVLERLISAGLDSLPGGGAEILVDDVRQKISPLKCTANEWIDVMRVAHKLGLKTTATMMFGHIETWQDRINHLQKLRDLQDDTGGFISFIPWTFQAQNTRLSQSGLLPRTWRPASAQEYLRVIAISRLFLDNIDHLQASLLTQGLGIAQLALTFGADDIGSVMLEEQVVSSAGCSAHKEITKDEIVRAIIASGHEPYERDTEYRISNKEHRMSK